MPAASYTTAATTIHVTDVAHIDIITVLEVPQFSAILGFNLSQQLNPIFANLVDAQENTDQGISRSHMINYE